MADFPVVPSVPLTTEHLADKVTSSSWGSVLAQAQHATKKQGNTEGDDKY